MVEQIIPRMVADENVVFAGLSRAELATLRTILRRMYDNIAGHQHAGEQRETKAPARRAKKR